MRTLTARPALRWLLLPLLLVLLGSYLLVARADAGPALPDRSAEQLLVDLQTAEVDGLSGTVVQTADLGIPAIPGASDGAAGKLTSLISGSHTLQVWYSGPDKARLRINDQYAETNVITNGRDVWTYDSTSKEATHSTLPADKNRAGADRAPADAPKTPQEAARVALDAIDDSTEISTDSAVTVADRAAYELVLRPKDKASLVTQVRVAIDGEKYVPLRVQVFGAGAKPAAEVTYTDVTFGAPDARNFEFNAPKGATVTEQAIPEPKEPTAAQKKELEARRAKADSNTKVVGEGWTAVVVTKLPDGGTTDNQTLQGFLGQLEPVSGAWGSGRQLNGTIMTAILTDDGRLAVGAVGSDLVQQALAR